jgi:hypothetical protein
MKSMMLNAILGVERIRRACGHRSVLGDLRDALERRAARNLRYSRRELAARELGINDRFNGMKG